MPRCNIAHNLNSDGLPPLAAQHTGLWYDKYIARPEQTTERAKHVAAATAIAEPTLYQSFFAQWQQALAAAGVVTKNAEVLNRLIVGLGGASVIETSITLHRTYGVPYIPGSALKGLAAAYARQRLGDEWQVDKRAYRTMFGYAPGQAAALPEAETDPGSAGFVTFFDALYVPHSGLHGRALHADVITVHHQDYYNSSIPAAPADWDAPNPVPFLTATGKYLLAIGGPPAWAAAAFNMLTFALIEFGVGAKTSADYGRMLVEGNSVLTLLSKVQPNPAYAPTVDGPGTVPSDPSQARVDNFILRVAKLKEHEVAGQMPNYHKEWQALDVAPQEKKRAAKAILIKVAEAGRERASRDKPWYQEIKAAAEE